MKQSQPKPNKGTAPLYVSTREAAAALAVHRNTVLNWIHAGHLRASKFGKTYRIPRERIDGGATQ